MWFVCFSSSNLSLTSMILTFTRHAYFSLPVVVIFWWRWFGVGGHETTCYNAHITDQLKGNKAPCTQPQRIRATINGLHNPWPPGCFSLSIFIFYSMGKEALFLGVHFDCPSRWRHTSQESPDFFQFFFFVFLVGKLWYKRATLVCSSSLAGSNGVGRHLENQGKHAGGSQEIWNRFRPPWLFHSVT